MAQGPSLCRPRKTPPQALLQLQPGRFSTAAPTSFCPTFIFVTEDGTISGWNGGQSAVLVVDNSDNGSRDGAVYKGATTADINGKRFLYVTNFRKARVEVYNTNFTRVRLGDDAFEAEGVPDGFAPFNIQNIGGTLFVTYAKQNSARQDDVPGDGLGFVLYLHALGPAYWKPPTRPLDEFALGCRMDSP